MFDIFQKNSIIYSQMEQFKPFERPEFVVPGFSPIHTVIPDSIETPVMNLFAVPGLAEGLQTDGAQFWFSPEFNASLRTDERSIAATSYVEVLDWKEGREASYHQVEFGNLVLTFDDGEVTTVPIAVKPYPGWAEYAVHEYAATQVINSSGFIESFKPLGFLVDYEGNIFYLTHFEEHVTSLDNIDWRKSADDRMFEHITNLEGLERAAYTLGRLHANGFVHRDAQIKNFAACNGVIRAIDLEQMALVHTPEAPNLELLQQEITHDLLVLIGSLYAEGYLEGLDKKGRNQVFRSAFLSNYRSTLRHPALRFAANYGEEALVMIDVVCDYLEELSREDIEAYFELAKHPLVANETET